jgi:cell division protein FtsB
MFDFQQKRKLRAILESRITWVLLLVVIVSIFVSAYDRYLIAKDMAGRRAEAEAELTELKARQTDLQKEVDYLSNERGIEAEVRRQFDVAREGEQVIIILGSDDAGAGVREATTTPNTRPWYRFW